MISVEKMLGNPPRIACASLLAGHASRSPHWHFELLGIAQKQRLLRYSTLQYTKYCGGLAPLHPLSFSEFSSILVYQRHPNKF